MPKTLWCPKCERCRRIKFFTRNVAKKNGYNNICSECHSRYTRRHYAENKKYYVDKARRATLARRLRMRAVTDVLKSRPCVDCGRKFHPIAMDFDHVRGKKVQSVSLMCNQGWSEKRIMEEIKKCEIRCAICHRLKTHKIKTNLRWHRMGKK